MTYITKEDINKFGSYTDRRNHFDDELDVDAFIAFLKTIYIDGNVEYRKKPFGEYGVDLGVYVNGKLSFTVDVERWSAWENEWPHFYSHVSFLGRKEKFLKRKENFVMVNFNYNRTKFICIDKKDIVKYPTIDRHTKGKLDKVRKISFDDARLYGLELTEREKSLFKNHKVREIK